MGRGEEPRELPKARSLVQEGQSVFHDENARFMPDPDHSDGEDRFVLLGLSHDVRLLVVVHCYRESDEVIRIISARKATRPESRQYEELL